MNVPPVEVSSAWHGGTPMMALPDFVNSIDIQHSRTPDFYMKVCRVTSRGKSPLDVTPVLARFPPQLVGLNFLVKLKLKITRKLRSKEWQKNDVG